MALVKNMHGPIGHERVTIKRFQEDHQERLDPPTGTGPLPRPRNQQQDRHRCHGSQADPPARTLV